MDSRSFRPSEIVGLSSVGFSDATDYAIAQAFEKFPELDTYDVTKLSGTFKGGQVVEWQVNIQVGYAK